jgi:hypothetical protein
MNMWRLDKVCWLSLSIVALAVPITSSAQILSITIAPPELPVYVQPAIPEPGYMWTPGYWAYGPDGYFWVPGTWVRPPSVGLLWTPGYWGWRDGVYAWNDGYWGPHIGFYGGVNYGYGYGGVGYEGGYWNHGVFAYNSSINNFGGVTITNVYNKTVIVNSSVTRVSFNGGTGGTTAQPTPQEQAASREQHVAATPAQAQHQQMASTNRALLASENHGQPAIAATAKAGEFSGKGVVAARQATPGPVTPGPKPAGGATAPGPTTPSNRASLGSGTSPKPLSPNAEAKPLAAVPPAKPLAAAPPTKPVGAAPPKVASKPNPPPRAATAAARPAAPAVAKRGPPPKKPPA